MTTGSTISAAVTWDDAVRSTPDAFRTALHGVRVPVTWDRRPARERESLAATIERIPSTSTESRVPIVSVRIIEDCWITGLDLAALTRFTAKAGVFFTMLDHAPRPTPTAYRTDWTTSHNTGSLSALAAETSAAQKRIG